MTSTPTNEPTTIGHYRPRWTPLEIVSLIVVFTVPILINLTIAESPSAWVLVGFGAVGVAVLWNLGRSRKRDATVRLTESPNGLWTLHIGSGNTTGNEQSLNPHEATSLALPPDNDTRPGFLLLITDDDGNQLSSMRIPATLVRASPNVRTTLQKLAVTCSHGKQRERLQHALNK